MLLFSPINLGFLPVYLQKQIINILLENGSDINFKDKNNGENALHFAVNNNEEIVEFLLENGADPNIKNDNGTTALHDAENVEIVKLLLIN